MSNNPNLERQWGKPGMVRLQRIFSSSSSISIGSKRRFPGEIRPAFRRMCIAGGAGKIEYDHTATARTALSRPAIKV